MTKRYMCNKNSKRWIPPCCEIASSIKCMINSPDGIRALARFRYRILHLFLHPSNIFAKRIERQNFGSRTRLILSDGPLLHDRLHEQCQTGENGRLPTYLMELFFGSMVLLLWSNRDTRSSRSSLSDIWCINDASERTNGAVCVHFNTQPSFMSRGLDTTMDRPLH